MCEFHDSNGNGFGDMWWTDKCTYFSSIDVTNNDNCGHIVQGWGEYQGRILGTE